MPQRDQVFVCYSHTDTTYLERLRVHFKPYEKQYSIKVWSDKKIEAGQEWRQEIENALQQTAVAILLISADFLASDFIANEELPVLLDAAQSEGVTILCFILSHCAFTSTILSKYQAVNNPAKPLTAFTKKSHREELWVELVQKATKALDEFRAQQIANDALEKNDRSSPSKIRWDKVATLFWLGNDLMWIMDMTFRKASPSRILQGILHATQYAKDLGFPKHSLPRKRLELAAQSVRALVSLYNNTPNVGDEDWMAHVEIMYLDVRENVEPVKWYIERLASEQEPDFKKLRAL